MKIVLDRSLCDSNALCVIQAPDLLRMDGNEELVLVKQELAPDEIERAHRAAAACPKAALRIEA